VLMLNTEFVELIKSVGFKLLTAVVMKSTVFWDTTSCSPLKSADRLCLPPAFTMFFLLGLFFYPEYGGGMFLRNIGPYKVCVPRLLNRYRG
jgi:hypothetical protein